MNDKNREEPDLEPVEAVETDFADLEIEPDGIDEGEEIVVGAPEPSEGTSISGFEDLTEETSVIDAGFASASMPQELPEDQELEEIEEIREIEVGDEDVTTRMSAEEIIPEDSAETGVIRKSLFDPVAPEEETQYVPVTGPQGGAPTATQPMTTPALPIPAPELSASDSSILAGATILPEVPSRAPSRWLSAIAYVLLVPLTWYLLADSGGRFLISTDSPWTTGRLNLAALGEFAGGIALLAVLAIVAANSSLGLYIAGAILLVLGTPFLFVPEITAQFLETYVAPPLERLGGLGGNLAYYLEFTGATGILFGVGFSMIAFGWVITRVRRTGRSEEALRVEVVEVNPEGLRARWAKKASSN